MIVGPVVDRDPNIDSSVAPIEGNNVRKNDDIVTLDYAEVEYITCLLYTSPSPRD